MDKVIIWDRSAFETINSGTANSFFDWLMPNLRTPLFWLPVYAFFIAFMIYNYKIKGLYMVLGALATFIISDQLSAHFLKFVFARDRPCRDPYLIDHVRMLVTCGPGYSMPSSHATNHFAISLYLISLFKGKIKWISLICITWAASVCYAQVYVGVHFPMDVIFGGILGSLIGAFMGLFAKSFIKMDDEEGPTTLSSLDIS